MIIDNCLKVDKVLNYNQQNGGTMKKESLKKKLTLNKTTISKLKKEKLDHLRGGVFSEHWDSCFCTAACPHVDTQPECYHTDTCYTRLCTLDIDVC